ncbi:TAXI family TRAP transporter solute-binding subunit [Niallia sp. Krafla_26]|uniref:TAXI family TRAP transporter solute-binding subunit n=1 Tax=Niallia sp. Krafla_26 TaxID=3064703 RepID=UPI003D16C1E1
MKKGYKLFGSLIIGITLLLSACGQTSSTDSDDSSKDKNSSPVITNIVGGSVGGSWSVFSEGIAESIRKTHEGSIVTVEPGGLVENPPLVGDNTVPFGIAYSMTSHAAYTGTEPYNKKYEDIRAVSVVIPRNLYQFVAVENAPYDSFDDIVESQYPARIVVDDKGSPGEIITRKILEAYGTSYEEIIGWGGSVDHLGGSKPFEMMSDNRADGTGDAIPVPDSSIIEASTTMKLKMISLNDDVIDKLEKDLGLIEGTVEASAYDFQKEAIKTVNTPAILITNKNVDDETVYKMVKSIYENLEYLGTVHEEFKKLTKENMADVGSVPLHPGAEKFFKEIGVIE